MKRILPFTLILMTAVTLAACGNTPLRLAAGSGGAMPTEAAAPMMDAAALGAPAQNSAGGVEAVSVERMVLKNAEIAIVVADVEARMNTIQFMATQMGGYVVSSNLYQSYVSENLYVPEAQLVIRVPAEQLDKALEQIKQDTVEVKNENVTGEDVTAQYVDLQSRLKNYEAAEAQLEEIMQSATETEDVVNIFNQLAYYREQIELVKGQMKYYEESAALSSITIHIIAEEKEKPFEVGGWKLSGTAREAAQDLIYFWQGFLRFLIRFVILILPALLTMALPFYLTFLIVRAVIRKLRGRKTPQPQPAEK